MQGWPIDFVGEGGAKLFTYIMLRDVADLPMADRHLDNTFKNASLFRVGAHVQPFGLGFIEVKAAISEPGQPVGLDKWFEVNTQPVMLAVKRLERQKPGFVQDKVNIGSIEQRKDRGREPVRGEDLNVNGRVRQPTVRRQ